MVTLITYIIQKLTTVLVYIEHLQPIWGEPILSFYPLLLQLINLEAGKHTAKDHCHRIINVLLSDRMVCVAQQKLIYQIIWFQSNL